MNNLTLNTTKVSMKGKTDLIHYHREYDPNHKILDHPNEFARTNGEIIQGVMDRVRTL